jgi:hypothetical protein
MKNSDFENFNIQPLTESEMVDTNGGFLPLLIIGVALLLTSCTVVVGDNNSINTNTTVSADSTANGTTVGAASGNTIKQ